MPLKRKGLTCVGYNYKRNPSIFSYSTDDPLNEIISPAYFSAEFASFKEGDVIFACHPGGADQLVILGDTISAAIGSSTGLGSREIVIGPSDTEYTTESGNAFIDCQNTSTLTFTLNPAATRSQKLTIKRSDGPVNFDGLINGLENQVIPSKGDILDLYFTGGQWLA